MTVEPLTLFPQTSVAAPSRVEEAAHTFGVGGRGGSDGTGQDEVRPSPSSPGAVKNARATDPDTSHRAAAIERGSLRERVRAVLEMHPDGLTDWELTDVLGLPAADKPAVGKRRQECEAVDSGARRPSPKGMACVVWVLR